MINISLFRVFNLLHCPIKDKKATNQMLVKKVDERFEKDILFGMVIIIWLT